MPMSVAREPSDPFTCPLASNRSPLRLQTSSMFAPWNSTCSPSSLANAAVMITRDRQFPARASNASEALRVIAVSYSSFSWPFVYSALIRPLAGPCERNWWTMSNARKCRIGSPSAEPSAPPKRSWGASKASHRDQQPRGCTAICEVAAQPLSSAQSTADTRICTRFLPDEKSLFILRTHVGGILPQNRPGFGGFSEAAVRKGDIYDQDEVGRRPAGGRV